MIWRFKVRTCARWMMTVSLWACLLAVTATLGFAYTTADVKRSEEMIASKDYKGAIKLLQAMAEDYEFCSANPADAAKASMLLSDACEASAENADACKSAKDAMKQALIQAWASLKKGSPDVKTRVEKMAQICEKHPQAFADFFEVILGVLVDSSPEQNRIPNLDAALAACKQIGETTQTGKALFKVDLPYRIAERYHRLNESKKVISVLSDVVGEIPKERQDMKADVLHLLVQSYFFTHDCENVMLYGRQCLQLKLNAEIKRSIKVFMIGALEEAERLEEAVKVARSMIADEELPDRKARNLLQAGGIYLRAKRYASAIEVYKEVQTIQGISDDTKAQAIYGTASCHHGLGDTKNAKQDLNTLLRLYADSHWAAAARGSMQTWYQSTDAAN